MDNEKIARQLVKFAKELAGKAEIDFQDIAEKLDGMIDEIDTHINATGSFYDRGTVSQIDKATRLLIVAKKIFSKIEAFDEDPPG